MNNKLRCKNLKISVHLIKYIDIEDVKAKNFCLTKKRTLYNIKFDQCSITIYKHVKNKILHVTGIQNGNNAIAVLKFISLNFGKIDNYVIDNSLFSCKNKKKINLHSIVKLDIKNYSITYLEEVFPALFLKPHKKFKELGVPTILIFSNSSYVIIGAKNLNSVKNADMLVKEIYKEC